MKKLLVALFAVCLVLPTAAYAEPPVDVAGDFTYAPTGCDHERWASDNQFVWACHDTGDWYNGPLDGDSEEVYAVAFHGTAEGGFMVGYEYAFYRGNVTFDGFVDGKEGTLEFLFVGFSPGALDDWNGTWRILGGTGELANLHGQGVFWSNGLMDVHYEGQIHFAP